MKTQKIFIASFILVFVLLLAGCSGAPQKDTPVKSTPGAYLTGATLDQQSPGSNKIFTVQVDHPGDPVGIDFSGAVTSGTVSVQLIDSTGKVVWQQTTGTGQFAMNQVVKPAAAGEYKLGLAWENVIKASYNLYWQPGKVDRPQITPIALLQGSGMVLVAVGFIVIAGVRKLGWRYLCLGALFWILTVALKFAFAIVFNGPVAQALTNSLPSLPAYALLDLYIGSLTGIFEVALTYLILRKKWGTASWNSALAFGIGFGAVEALLLGFNSLAAVVTALAAPTVLPLNALQSLGVLNNPLWGMPGVIERFFTIWVHIASNVLIFYAIAVRQPKWFWYAFIYKTLLDTLAAYIQVSGLVTNLGAIWATEAAIAILGGAGWWFTIWLSKRYPAEKAPAALPVEPPVSTAV